MRKKIWVTDIPIFNKKIAVTRSKRKALKFAGVDEDIPTGSDGCFISSDGVECAIWFAEKRNTGTAAHESLHAATWCMESIGCPPTSHVNDEMLAYLMQWILEWITDETEVLDGH